MQIVRKRLDDVKSLNLAQMCDPDRDARFCDGLSEALEGWLHAIEILLDSALPRHAFCKQGAAVDFGSDANGHALRCAQRVAKTRGDLRADQMMTSLHLMQLSQRAQRSAMLRQVGRRAVRKHTPRLIPRNRDDAENSGRGA